MGNCDTHVFLGSNSFKTVEYFSKQLGETTIVRDTKSTNRYKNYYKQGYSTSDQVMGRALMTPDELRRMDNDLCIIFEKGLKPIKAKKFYYFRKPMIKEFQKYAISHNNFDSGVRGEWRKFNPMNPYVENKGQTQNQDLKIESLDDLFEEEPKSDSKPTSIVEKKEPMAKQVEEIPTLPMEEETPQQEELFSIDLQKELEAKFDELFGPVDNNNNN